MVNEEPDTLEVHLNLILRDQKGENLGQFTEKVLTDRGFLDELLHGLIFKDENCPNNGFKVWYAKIIDYFLKQKLKEKKMIFQDLTPLVPGIF